jgi:class 3 adenylate cyclase
MVDKLIGDGMFALFNVPLDLANHVERAVAAAQAIVAATESYRRTPLPAALALGRTRIGIETGTAIVGDVGGGNKIDFTAFGNVVNTASRLEGLNKDFNTMHRPVGRCGIRRRTGRAARRRSTARHQHRNRRVHCCGLAPRTRGAARWIEIERSGTKSGCRLSAV